jgi:hypothetical protein
MPLNPARGLRRFACLALLFGAAGCAGLNDPFQREGTWRPENINDTNMAAMVAYPRQLEHGVGDDSSPAVLSAAAVHRLLTDHLKPLATTSLGPVAASQEQPGTPSAPGSGGTP